MCQTNLVFIAMFHIILNHDVIHFVSLRFSDTIPFLCLFTYLLLIKNIQRNQKPNSVFLSPLMRFGCVFN